MPRYRFLVTDKDGRRHVEVAHACADLDEAIDHCRAILSDMIGEALPNGDLCMIVCDVQDDAGRVVYWGSMTFEATADV